VYQVMTTLVSVSVTTSQFIGIARVGVFAALAYARSGSTTGSSDVEATTVAHCRISRRVGWQQRTARP
jgi:hypothetical protein